MQIRQAIAIYRSTVLGDRSFQKVDLVWDIIDYYNELRDGYAKLGKVQLHQMIDMGRSMSNRMRSLAERDVHFYYKASDGACQSRRNQSSYSELDELRDLEAVLGDRYVQLGKEIKAGKVLPQIDSDEYYTLHSSYTARIKSLLFKWMRHDATGKYYPVTKYLPIEEKNELDYLWGLMGHAPLEWERLDLGSTPESADQPVQAEVMVLNRRTRQKKNSVSPDQGTLFQATTVYS